MEGNVRRGRSEELHVAYAGSLRFLWAPVSEYKEAKSTGRPAEDWGQGKEVGTW